MGNISDAGRSLPMHPDRPDRKEARGWAGNAPKASDPVSPYHRPKGSVRKVHEGRVHQSHGPLFPPKEVMKIKVS